MISIFKSSKKIGLPPGTLMSDEDKQNLPVKIQLFQYSENSFEELYFNNIDDCLNSINKKKMNWINITGIHNNELLQKTGDFFGLHHLLLEDIQNTAHYTKTEIEKQYLFLNPKEVNLENDQFFTRQISLILMQNVLISIHEDESAIFDPIISRLRTSEIRIKMSMADYMFNLLTDIIVDNYFRISEHISDKLEETEDLLFAEKNDEALENLQDIRKKQIHLRKITGALQEALTQLSASNSKLLKEQNTIYFRDVREHVYQLNQTVDTYREIMHNQKDMHTSNVSNSMNQVMKVLTIIATIFIPLTFIAGIYGMNFANMPELNWQYGYFAVLGLMLIIFLGMIFYFRRKKWL